MNLHRIPESFYAINCPVDESDMAVGEIVRVMNILQNFQSSVWKLDILVLGQFYWLKICRISIVDIKVNFFGAVSEINEFLINSTILSNFFHEFLEIIQIFTEKLNVVTMAHSKNFRWNILLFDKIFHQLKNFGRIFLETKHFCRVLRLEEILRVQNSMKSKMVKKCHKFQKFKNRCVILRWHISKPNDPFFRLRITHSYHKKCTILSQIFGNFFRYLISRSHSIWLASSPLQILLENCSNENRAKHC